MNDIREEFRLWLNIQFIFHKNKTDAKKFYDAFHNLMKQIASNVRWGTVKKDKFHEARLMFYDLIK